MLTKLPDDKKINFTRNHNDKDNFNKALTIFGKRFAKTTKCVFSGATFIGLGAGIISQLTHNPELAAELYTVGACSGLGAIYSLYTEKLMDK